MSDLRAAVEAAMDVGTYPASSPSGPRTAWENGWNAAVDAIEEAVRPVIDAHQCYKVAELAEALRAWSFPEHAARPDLYPIGPDSGWMKQATAIIARLT